MWPYHKAVCGSSSHPFALPPFSQAEADFTYTNLATTERDALAREYLPSIYEALEIPIYHLDGAEVGPRGGFCPSLPSTAQRYRRLIEDSFGCRSHRTSFAASSVNGETL